MPEYRLGDVIDDHCVKCRRIMNVSIVSMVGSEPAKVRCRTCYHEQDYRHEQAPRPRTDRKKETLFNEVLAKMNPAEATGESSEVLKRKSKKAGAREEPND
jgi:hypothetical protein